MGQRSIREATISFIDGDASVAANGDISGGDSITVKIGEGNLTWSEKRPVEFIRDRGLLSSSNATARLADDEPMDVSLDFIWEWVLSDSDVTPYEAITQKGSASGWSSTAGACEPYAIDIVIKFEACGGDIEVIKLSKFMYESIDFDPREGMISVSGRCFDTTISDNVTSSAVGGDM